MVHMGAGSATTTPRPTALAPHRVSLLQAVFEGMKAQRTAQGRIVLFRPDANADRMIEGGWLLSRVSLRTRASAFRAGHGCWAGRVGLPPPAAVWQQCMPCPLLVAVSVCHCCGSLCRCRRICCRLQRF